MNQPKTTEMFPVPASRMVCWYFRGDTSQQPRLAFVTSFGKMAGLNLHALEDGQEKPVLVSGVRHRDDPYHAEHLEHAISAGVWDYLPGQDPRVALPPTTPYPGPSLPTTSAHPITESNAITSGPGSRAFKQK